MPCKMIMLEKVIKRAKIEYGTLSEFAMSYEESKSKWDLDNLVQSRLPLLQPLQNVTSNEIRKRLARANISIEGLKNTFSISGSRGIRDLFSSKMNNKPIVMSHQKTIDKITAWLQNQ